MARHPGKPEVGDVISFHSETLNMKILGTVQDLLSMQFTLHVLEPEKIHGFTVFVFYAEDWIYDVDGAFRCGLTSRFSL